VGSAPRRAPAKFRKVGLCYSLAIYLNSFGWRWIEVNETFLGGASYKILGTSTLKNR
jgi:hypothetical protein